MADFFWNLAELQIVGDREVQINRRVVQLATPGGRFGIRAPSAGPRGVWPVVCEIDSLERIEAFWAWYDSVLGALMPFWLPTFQRDFVPIGTVADIDTAITILNRDFALYEFPDVARRSIGLVRLGETILKREIITAVNNGDGTETITLNEPFGVPFTQARANGLCYLLYVRLTDDKVQMDWWTHDIATVTFSVTELRDDIPTGSDL
jgi:hypothetical protein